VAPLFEGITVVFDDYLAHGWGWGNASSRNFRLEPTGGVEGSAAIHLQWHVGAEMDRHRRMGMSWTAWRGVDFRSAPEAQLRFLIRSGADTLPVEGLRVGWEGWDGAVTTVPVDFTRLQGSRIDGQWRWVTVPLKDFPFLQDRVDPARIRQLIFEVSPETSGDVWIDQIRIHHEG
jgi:hypothetical protein